MYLYVDSVIGFIESECSWLRAENRDICCVSWAEREEIVQIMQHVDHAKIILQNPLEHVSEVV